MEEILTLHELLLAGDVNRALAIVEEMEEMGLTAIRNRIRSYSKILLIHLIKQAAEKRSTRSWELSIQNSVDEILNTNQRSAGSYYIKRDELTAILEKVYGLALKAAAIEAFEGRHEAEELAAMVDRPEILQQALKMIAPEQ
ncbi:hypothetical protein AMR42_11985 [Limnothrix sp. PR1529]|uniref:DUF29 family protein n=1 Tax=Limnothrix sp. PR1529 TaxID=1704291 RepID=UPI00081F6968|nr:DUF29 family protein [Limnothrix sp. PR1529]OCQ90760.1 hypothetical protein BCR12_03415 [Limnothrix sp. P13C2]PIB09879.1 hypothetical protein AMR42_11985 [Limnothrix sp. PR1529]